MSHRRSPEQWRALLSAFRRSDQTQADFCSDHGLSVSSLQYQLRRDRSGANEADAEESAAPRLLEIVPTDRRDDLRPGEPDPILRVECSLDSRHLSIECAPDDLARLLAELSSFHRQRGARP